MRRVDHAGDLKAIKCKLQGMAFIEAKSEILTDMALPFQLLHLTMLAAESMDLIMTPACEVLVWRIQDRDGGPLRRRII